MDQFFSRDFDGGPFQLFSGSHLIALIFFLIINILLIIFRKRIPSRARTYLPLGMAAILVLNELMWHIWNIVTGQWTLQTMLPLHLCSVLVWLNAYMLISRNYRIYEFAYLLGIAGALQAMLTPDLGIYAFPHFRYFQVFISHGLIITSAVYMTAVEGFRPYPRSILRVFLVSNLYMIAVTALNLAIGSNYLFTAHKPPTASLLDVLPPWPWYLIIIELLGMTFVLLFYLPFAIRDIRQKRLATTSP
jgi:hypothetical integral membrane protein (TIGR02206 family)